ncbi:unnamed protein product [Caenorhabditis nigoni]|uniref:Uncharacterized protein n=2 Tax=Caenorhabditis nigoni TaxID=1611254 RepID=A0A2G5T511_9PELO|nr:hypothetical protein B9Z55_016439 [Caenorhabditis nigoni]
MYTAYSTPMEGRKGVRARVTTSDKKNNGLAEKNAPPPPSSRIRKISKTSKSQTLRKTGMPKRTLQKPSRVSARQKSSRLPEMPRIQQVMEKLPTHRNMKEEFIDARENNGSPSSSNLTNYLNMENESKTVSAPKKHILKTQAKFGEDSNEGVKTYTELKPMILDSQCNLDYQHDNEPDDFDEEEVLDEEQEEDLDEEQDTDLDEEQEEEPADLNFSVRDLFNKTTGEEAVVEKIQNQISHGSVEGVGSIIRTAVSEGKITDVQLQEVASALTMPKLSIVSLSLSVNNAVSSKNMDQLGDILVGTNFMNMIPRDEAKRMAHVEARISSISSAKSSKFALNDLKKRLLEIPHIFPGEGIFCRVHLGELYYSTPPIGTGSSNQLMNIFKTIFVKLVSPQYLIWTISYRPNSGRRDDKNFDCFPEALVTVLKDFGMDVLANYIPTRLLPADANMDDKFVKALPYPFEEACKEIVRRRNSYESADKLVRHAIHGALQLLRTYHYDTANGILVNCKKRSECSTHLTWKEYKSKLGGGNQDV